MTVINTNVKALYTQAAMKTSGRDLENAMQQLSTGKRINSARDDAAGMAIATRMTQQIRSLNQAVRNAGDAISLIQTTEGATAEITDMLQRMRELAIQAINDTNSGEQRSYLDLEFQQLKQEIVRISNTTEWNGFSVLDGTAGYAVGERPVYKTTSEADFDSVFINPTTSRAISGDTAGEYQVVTMSGTASADGTITIGGVSVDFKGGDSKEAVAVKVGQALRSSDDFAASTGRKVVVSGGEVQITYGVGEKNVPQIVTTATAVSGITATPSSPIRNAAVAQISTLKIGTSQGGGAIVAGDKVSATINGKVIEITVAAGDLDSNSVTNTHRNIALKLATAYNASTETEHTGITAAAATGAATAATTTANNAGAFETAAFNLSAIDTTASPKEEKITFGAAITAGGNITVAGVTVAVAQNDTAITVAGKVQTALAADAFITQTGRSVVDNGDGSITIKYAAVDAAIANATFADTVPTGVTAASTVEKAYVAGGLRAGETITVGGVTFTASATASAANIAQTLGGGTAVNGSISGSYSGYTATFNGTTLTLQSTAKAPQVDLTAATSTNAALTTALTAGPTVTDGVTPIPQVDTISLSNDFVAGQKLSFTVGTTPFEYVVKGSDIATAAVPETQKLTFSAATNGGTITVDGISVTAAQNATASAVATAVRTALIADAKYNQASGREITDNGDGSLSIRFLVTDGSVADLVLVDSNPASGVGVTNVDEVTYKSIEEVTRRQVAQSMADAFNASVETEHRALTAAASAASVTLTADAAGTAFTTSAVQAELGVISLVADTAGVAFTAAASVSSPTSTGISATAATFVQNLDKATGDAITSADENFTANGAFLRSGLLNITTTFENSVTGVTARFTTSDGEVVAMTAELDVAAGTVTLKQASGDNAKIISDDLTYTFKDPTGAVEELGGRKLSLDVAVPGTIPAMSTGDLVINGVVIGASYTADDSLSPPNNASGSAIAKAATINRYTEETGVFAVVNENIMGGAPQSGTSIVTGRVVINGIESSLITTVLNNTRESRAATITAINQIADKTGVRAIDTEDDDEGVRLLARDGRNIEVRFVTDYPITDFGARTGLREGVQAGTYSLETKVEGELVVTTTDTGVIERSGLKLGDFTKNESTLSTAARKPITNGQTPVALNAGDLVINGVSIRGAMTSDDKSTDPIALVTDSNIRAASAVAIAAAINASTEQTGVRATANPVVLESDLTTIDASRTDGRYKLWVNGAEVEVEFRQTHTASERVNAVIAAITPKFGATGIVAEANAKGGLTLTTQDGRNLSVWFDDTQDAAAGATTLKPEEFGLAMVSTGKAAEGVTSKTDAATIANASTLYGGVTLHSEKAFTIEPGGNGYAARSNFTALGFQEGTFGGEVDEATTKMSPPRTGRLTFHVGASAGQVITIDLADFGSGGPVTGDITNDVAAGDGANRVNRIDSAASASSVLEKLDVAMDKVNATRGRMGAVMNRLEHVIDNLMNVSMHSEASRSQIEDADYAAASTELARTQIMQQAATAVLAQANASQQNVLSLLQ